MNYVFELMKAEQYIHQQGERIAYLEAHNKQLRASIHGINARLHRLEQQQEQPIRNTTNILTVIKSEVLSDNHIQ